MTFPPVVRRVARATCRTAAVLGVLTVAAVAVGPRTGRYQVFHVLSDSMAPAMPRSALIVSVPAASSSVEAGDVITFRAPIGDHHIVTHRVLEVVEGGEHPVVRTKGDANRAADPWRARLEDDRTWRVVAVVPHAGAAVVALRGEVPRILLTVVTPVLLGAFWLRWIWAKPGARRANVAG